MHGLMTWPWFFFERDARKKKQSNIQSQDGTGERRGHLVCAACRALITRESARIAVQGDHEHSFFNPHGLVFRIGCFSEAPGCLPVGLPSSDFSWFPGHHWQIVHCRRCEAHLGWCFLNGGNPVFLGLILNRLVLLEEKA